MVGAVWGVALQGILMNFWMKYLPSFLPPGGTGMPPLAASQLQSMLLFNGILGLVIVPFSELLGMLLCALLAHLGLLMTGAPRKDLAATMAVYAYGMGSASLFKIVPGIGPLVSLCWGPVCCIAGVIRVHGCKAWQGIFAALWWLLLCCCCIATGILAAIGIPALMALG